MRFQFIWKAQKSSYQNAWSQMFQKNKFTWKKATEPFSKMLEAKKTNTPIEKKHSVSKKLKNSHGKKFTEPSSKMPEAKKQTLPLKKQFCFKKRL